MSLREDIKKVGKGQKMQKEYLIFIVMFRNI